MKYDVAKLIRARQLRGWTRARLAAEIGRSENMVYKIERGERASEETIFRMSRKLRVPMKKLLLKDDAA